MTNAEQTASDGRQVDMGLGPNAPLLERLRLRWPDTPHHRDNLHREAADEIERLRAALQDAGKVLLQIVPYSSDDEDLSHMEHLRTSALNSVRWALGPNAE